MKEIVEKIKNGAKALLAVDGNKIMLVERINEHKKSRYDVSLCCMGETGWEYTTLAEFSIGEETALEKFMQVFSGAERWEITLPVPSMK